MIKFDIDDRGLLRPHLRPLICLVVYGTDAHFACLNLLVGSLVDFGKFDGEVAIFSDRNKDHVLTYIPNAMKPRTLHFSLRDTSLMGRYTIADNDLSQYCPILYLDNDIIVDNDITPHLARIAAQEGICV